MSTSYRPIGQHTIQKNLLGQINWPVLTAGKAPEIDTKNYKLEIIGEVEKPISFTYTELEKLSKTELISDIHCVTTWSLSNAKLFGVDFYEIIKLVNPKQTAISVSFESDDEIGYTTSVKFDSEKKLLYFPYEFEEYAETPHSYFDKEKKRIYYTTCLLILAANADIEKQVLKLDKNHGGPVRNFIPDLYFWKSAKFLNKIRFSTKHELGFWEVRGYSDSANPFVNDRYSDGDKVRYTKAQVYKSNKTIN